MAASLLASTSGGTAMALVNTATVITLAILLMRGDRRHDGLRRTRVLLLAALGAAFASGVMPVAYQLVAGREPSRPWVGDAVALAYVPFTIAGMLCIPAASRRTGHRVRAFADGLLAGSSLWYLLVTLGAQHGHAYGTAAMSGLVSYAYPVGDVFVVSAALTVLARCAPAAAGLVGWMVAGLSAVAANDLWIFVTGQPATAAGPALLYQGGLLLLVGAAATPAVRFSDDVDTTVPFAAVLGAVPFLPLLLCMVATARIAVRGDGLAPDQVLPALAVAIALTLRQFAGSRDKQRLVRQLQAREVGLQAALRIDGLTGLANRLGVAERLDSALSDPAQWPVSVALLDLNEFKLINDNHGHPVGDEVLRVVAARLSRVVRGDDTVARLGGDEFAIITTAVDERQRELLQARLIAAFDEPIQAGGQRFSVHASIGIVVGRPPDTPAQLLAHADAAMYRAKDGRGYDSRAAVLDDAGRADVARQLRVREAIADPDLTQFQVHYQPVVDLATGHIRAFEALLRWRHPDLGPVPPDTFIPLAEQSGSIGTIGQFVLEQATADLAKIVRARPERQLVVSVNVSPRQLSDEAFVTRTLRLLADRGLRPDQLALEVTEQAFEANLGPVADTVAALAAAGVHVAVDDFGTGYSSLRYLQRLRLDIMKIDRSFVDEIDGTAADQLVPAVTTMAAGLGLQVVAEGIETLDQLRLLQQINCELGQGYLFSAPMPIAQLERLIAEGHTYQVGAGDAAPLLPSPRRVDDTGVRVSDRTPRDS